MSACKVENMIFSKINKYMCVEIHGKMGADYYCCYWLMQARYGYLTGKNCAHATRKLTETASNYLGQTFAETDMETSQTRVSLYTFSTYFDNVFIVECLCCSFL